VLVRLDHVAGLYRKRDGIVCADAFVCADEKLTVADGYRIGIGNWETKASAGSRVRAVPREALETFIS